MHVVATYLDIVREYGLPTSSNINYETQSMELAWLLFGEKGYTAELLLRYQGGVTLKNIEDLLVFDISAPVTAEVNNKKRITILQNIVKDLYKDKTAQEMLKIKEKYNFLQEDSYR